MKKLCYFSVILFVMLGASLYAQKEKKERDVSPKKLYKNASKEMLWGDFDNAVKKYQKLSKMSENKDNANLQYKIGMCYFWSLDGDGKVKAIDYLEKATKKNTLKKYKDSYNTVFAPNDAYFYLAKSYSYNYNLDEAIYSYKKLKDLGTDSKKSSDKKSKESESTAKFEKDIDLLIKQCENAKSMVGNRDLSKETFNANILNEDTEVENLGEPINSKYSEHSPFYSAKDEILYFTSRRKGTVSKNKNKVKINDGEYYEDVYMCQKSGDGWGPVLNLKSPINTEKHESISGFSEDGKMLIIYRSNAKRGDVYTSLKNKNKWETLNKNDFKGINRKRTKEDHATIATDNKDKESIVYFSSNVNGNLYLADNNMIQKRSDIFTAKKNSKGEWVDVTKLDLVDSEYDEIGPNINKTGDTLYFSSNGLASMGGLDVFRVVKDKDGKWSKPENLGYPINTTGDDVFYYPIDNKYAYYSSDNAGKSLPNKSNKGSMGSNDLYIAGPAFIYTLNTIITSEEGEPVQNVNIVLKEKESGQELQPYNVDGNQYTFKLRPGNNYNLMCEKENYLPFSQLVETTKKLKDQDETMMIEMTKIKEAEIVGDSTVIENILFGFNEYKTGEYDNVLNNIASILSKDNSIVLEVGGHTDFVSSEQYNKQLSLKRAGFVKDYLLKQNVKKESVVIKGYGEEQPIAKQQNKNRTINKEGTKYNRRVEFKVLKQDEKSKKIVVKPIMVPADLILE